MGRTKTKTEPGQGLITIAFPRPITHQQLKRFTAGLTDACDAAGVEASIAITVVARPEPERVENGKPYTGKGAT